MGDNWGIKMVRDYLKRGLAVFAIVVVVGTCKADCFAANAMTSVTEAVEVEATHADDSAFVEIPDEDVPLGILPEHRNFSIVWIPVTLAIALSGAGFLVRRQLHAAKKVCTFESLSEVKFKM